MVKYKEYQASNQTERIFLDILSALDRLVDALEPKAEPVYIEGGQAKFVDANGDVNTILNNGASAKKSSKKKGDK